MLSIKTELASRYICPNATVGAATGSMAIKLEESDCELHVLFTSGLHAQIIFNSINYCLTIQAKQEEK